MQEFHKDARFLRILLYSVLAHVLLLSVVRLPPPRYVASPGEGLTVSLRAESPPSAPALAASPAPLDALEVAPPPLRRPPEVTPPSPRRILSMPRPAPSPPLPATPPESAPIPMEAVVAPVDATSGVAADGVDAGEVAQASSQGAGQGVAAANAQTAAGGTGDADVLSAYLLAIGGNAGKLKRYPEQARALGHEGLVKIRLIWRPEMSVPQVELQQGSGSALLDRQGLQMLRQAAARTPMPEALRQRAFSLVLPVEFTLEQRD